MTAAYFEAPIALISIVEAQRQWFRAQVGLDTRETPRDLSFCAHTLTENGLFEVLDAAQDPRFKDSELVRGSPYIRYYASAPLRTADGFNLGSLCIIDTHPRPCMSARDSAMLVNFAELAMMRISGVRSRNFVDQPTGLFNRLRFEEDIRITLLNGKKSLVYCVDVIAPQALNDVVKALGYSFAQDLILAIKARLQTLIPSGRLLYKVSPTRFGFILDEHDAIDSVCQKIIDDFKTPVECQHIPIPMQIGVGVLPVLEASQKDQDWLRLVVSAADAARDQNVGWARYEPQLDAAQQRAFMLLSALHDALTRGNQLSLVYQPKIQLPELTCESVEALIRWNHPTLGVVSPAEFIPLAEKTALMQSITFWVLDALIEQARAWAAQGLHLRIAMNVTVNDLQDSRLVDAIEAHIQARRLDPQMLELELTESILMSKPVSVLQELERARRLGLHIAIDDFGTGYSNWAYLRKLPAQTVKLDQSLVRTLETSAQDRRLVKTLIELAKGLNYHVVAEGVENNEILRLITEWGCSQAQGFLIARPLEDKALTTWLANGGFKG
ncbi:sensor domain-containing phosphodiesterase [Pseudomonas lundensis]|nr:sensor domain-containing phosphodiesterase [Pseudomonas lundensis]